MDAPPLSAAAATAVFHSDSADSLPHSRPNDSLNADPPKLRLMCSYGGHIVPRPHDKTLSYIGGETRIIVIDRNTSFSDLHARLSKNLLQNRSFSLKYQLPGEDLDSLISVSTDEDLENMVEEYDRLNNAGGGQKGGRLRLFLFPGSGSASGIEQVVLETSSAKSEDWFFDTLNGKPSSSVAASDRGFSESSSVNCLLGLDDELVGKTVVGVGEKDVEAQIEGATTVGTGIGNGNISGNSNYAMNHDIHSIPGSPMLGTTSSFGSTSSSPSVPNLPPTGVHVEDNLKAGGLGIEEQFQQQVSVGIGEIVNLPRPQKQEEAAGLTAAAVTGETMVAGLPPVVVVGGEHTHRGVSDDEKSEHGAYPKVQQSEAQVQQQLIPSILQKQTSGFDLSSPDSVSSDGNARDPLCKPTIYQEQLKQIQPGNPTPTVLSDQVDLKAGDQIPTTIPMLQQPQEAVYMSPHKFDQNYPQLHQSHHFIPAGNHYIPAGAVPFVSYYPVYPPQQQHNPHQPYPVYILPGNQNQPYNLPVQQPNYSELAPSTPSSCSQTSPAATMNSHTAFSQASNVPSSTPEMIGGLYGTGAPQLVQLPSGQHQVQYITFSPYARPPQPVASSSAVNSTYDFADPANVQMYYRPLPPHMAAQYPSNTSTPARVIPDSSSQHNS